MKRNRRNLSRVPRPRAKNTRRECAVCDNGRKSARWDRRYCGAARICAAPIDTSMAWPRPMILRLFATPRKPWGMEHFGAGPSDPLPRLLCVGRLLTLPRPFADRPGWQRRAHVTFQPAGTRPASVSVCPPATVRKAAKYSDGRRRVSPTGSQDASSDRAAMSSGRRGRPLDTHSAVDLCRCGRV